MFYIKSDTNENWNCMIGVKEQVVTLCVPQIVAYPSQKKMGDLYCAAIHPVLKYSREVSSV